MYCFNNSSPFYKSNFSSPVCGFTAQLVEHRTGIAEVTGSNPVKALIFFRLLPSNCFSWKIYCDDHSSLSSHVTFRDDHFHFYVPSFFYGTTQTPHYVGFCCCPLTTLVVTRNCQTSCLHKCLSFMAKNASKAYTKNNTSRKQTRQPGFTDGNDNGL